MALFDSVRNLARRQDTSNDLGPQMSPEEVDRILQAEVYQHQAELEAKFKQLEIERKKEIALEEDEQKRIALSKKLLDEARFRQEYLYPKAGKSGSSVSNLKGALDSLINSGDKSVVSLRDALDDILAVEPNSRNNHQNDLSIDAQIEGLFSDMGSTNPAKVDLFASLDEILTTQRDETAIKKSLIDDIESLLTGNPVSQTPSKKSLLDALNDI